MLRHSIVLVALLAFPACTAIGAVTDPISSAAPAEFNNAKRALTAAHLVHKTTADFLIIAAQTNLCHAACASTSKSYLDQSEAALVAADKLIAVGDAAGIEAKISTATAAIGAIQNLVGKH